MRAVSKEEAENLWSILPRSEGDQNLIAFPAAAAFLKDSSSIKQSKENVISSVQVIAKGNAIELGRFDRMSSFVLNLTNRTSLTFLSPSENR